MTNPGFVDLPAEIRYQIYKLLFTGSKVRYLPPRQYRTRTESSTGPLASHNAAQGRAHNITAIIMVSRLTYSEAHPVLLANSNIDATRLVVEDWTTKLRSECSNLALQIRRLRLDFASLQTHLSLASLSKTLKHMPNIASVVFERVSNPYINFTPQPGAIRIRLSDEQLPPDAQTKIAAEMRRWLSPTYGAFRSVRRVAKERRLRGCSFSLDLRFGFFTILQCDDRWARPSRLHYDAVYSFGSSTLLLTRDTMPRGSCIIDLDEDYYIGSQ